MLKLFLALHRFLLSTERILFSASDSSIFASENGNFKFNFTHSHSHFSQKLTNFLIIPPSFFLNVLFLSTLGNFLTKNENSFSSFFRDSFNFLFLLFLCAVKSEKKAKTIHDMRKVEKWNLWLDCCFCSCLVEHTLKRLYIVVSFPPYARWTHWKYWKLF